MPPSYNLDKIKFATDRPTFEKAVALYENGKVTQFREEISCYSAVVLGTKPYRVSIVTERTREIAASLNPIEALRYE